MAEKLFVFVFILCCMPQTSHQEAGSKSMVNLKDGDVHVVTGSKDFCYQNTIVPSWKHTWTRIQVKVWSSKKFQVHIVEDEQQLQELERFSFWGWIQNYLREMKNETSVNINLFSKKTCIKVVPPDGTQYTVKQMRMFDIYLFLVFLAGVLLFMFADSLARSQTFYYSTGVSTGVIASLIIFFFVLYRFMPKKSPFYVALVGGWSFSVYIIQLVYKNLQTILKDHWHYALGYVGLVGFISFAVCYRYGPLVDERSINILSWTLQLVGLLLIYAGIQIQPVAFAIIVSLVLAKNLEYPVNFAFTLWRKFRGYVHWKPEPRRLLTEEEYQRQGEEETRRGLEELRSFCKSPECNTWKTVSRLQSPQRFAGFMEGSSHVMPNEVSMHSQEYGFGGSFFEDDIFDTDDEEDLDEKPPIHPH